MLLQQLIIHLLLRVVIDVWYRNEHEVYPITQGGQGGDEPLEPLDRCGSANASTTSALRGMPKACSVVLTTASSSKAKVGSSRRILEV